MKKKIKICGKVITIKKKELDNLHGEYVHDAAVIYLSDDPKLAKDAWPTLLHEMIHAVLAITGVNEVLGSDKEEAVCRAIENLAPLLELKK